MTENYIPINLDDWDLHRAAEENRADIARLLISAGADIEAAKIQEQEKFLDLEAISNYTVQDFRPIYEMKKTFARLSQVDNPLIGKGSVKLLTNDIVDASFGRKESYFSNLFISYLEK